METKPSWRAMTAADLDGVVTVARASFPNHFEERACFAERLSLFPQMCYTLATPDTVEGYLIAYPWTAASAPPLNTLIHHLPAHPELIYLHDLALLPRARGHGHTRPIVEHLVTQARADGWTRIALVAVNDAAAFWQRLGFTVDGSATDIASYSDGAAYMIRDL